MSMLRVCLGYTYTYRTGGQTPCAIEISPLQRMKQSIARHIIASHTCFSRRNTPYLLEKHSVSLGETLRSSVYLSCKQTLLTLLNSPKGHFLRSLMLLLLMIAVGVDNVWGQVVEGSWFIASGGNAYKVEQKTAEDYTYGVNTPDDNFYIVPASDPEQPNKNDAYFDGDDAAKPFLTTYKSGLANEAIWVLEKVEDEPDTYYIKHANTGKYVIFEKFFSDGNWRRKCMHLDGITPSVAGKFKVTYNSKGYYNIVPKNPINKDGKTETSYIYWNVSDRNRNTRHGVDKDNYYGGLMGLYNDKNDVNSKWMFERAKCATPTISFNNETNVVTITTTTTGATIYYTMGENPADPTASSNDGTGTTPVTIENVTNPTTIKAIAVKQYWEDSEIETLQITKVGDPIFTRTGSSLAITSDTENATIFYTLEASGTPSTEYTAALTVSSGQTIRAIAKKDGCITSAEKSYVVMDVCATPTIAVAYNDGTATVTITNNQDGATIHYTTDGSVPDGDSQSYSSPFNVTSNMITSGMTVRAIAVKSGFNNSNVAEATVEQVAMPVIAIVNNEIAISCATDGATIYYTIDGGAVTAYTAALGLEASGKTITAYAIKTDMVTSATAVADANSTKLKLGAPVITYDPATNKVVITSITGATIKYTTGETAAEDPSTGQTYDNGNTGFELTDGHHVIKAIAEMNMAESSDVATLTIVVQPSDDNHLRPYLIQSVQCTDFYLIPGDAKGVNTSSLGSASMEWCFYHAGKSAGNADGGVDYDYYYIKNKNTNQYVYFQYTDKATVRMDPENTFNNANATGKNNYKYRLTYVNDANNPGYYIHPYTSGTAANGLIKTGGNNSPDAVNLADATTTANTFARWNFIPSTKKPDMSPQLKVWGSNDRTYYKIKKDNPTIATNTNYLLPRSKTVSYAIASVEANVSGPANSILWYFDKDDASSNEWVTYYYVVNAATGEYLYFNGDETQSANDNALEAREELVAADNDRYLFAFAKTTTADRYYILPKALQDLVKNSYSLVFWDGTSALTSAADRAADGGKWYLTEADVTDLCPPRLTLDADGKVTMASRTRGATIKYEVGSEAEQTFDGTTNPIKTMATEGEKVVITTKTTVGETTTTNSATVVYKPTITLAEQSVVYNGQTHAPELSSVTMGDTELKDYCVVSSNDINAGDENAATAIISQKENNPYYADPYYVVYGTAQFTIEKSPLTIYANGKMIEYGDAIPELSFSTNGLATIDEVHVKLNCGATASSKLGTYPITFSNLDNKDVKYEITRNNSDASPNYKDVTLIPSSLVITGKSLGDGTQIAEGITAELTANGEDISVTAGNSALVKGTDFGVVESTEGYYDDKIWAISGIGHYTGSAQVARVKSAFSERDGEWRAGYVASHDWAIPEGSTIEAWIATNVYPSVNVVQVKKVDYLPTDVPAILTANADKSAGVLVSPKSDETAELTASQKAVNKLKVATEKTDVGSGVYIFRNGEFVLAISGKMPKGSIYLEKPSGSSSNAPMRLVKSDVTGIVEINEDKDRRSFDDTWYSLDGRKLSGKPTKKGIYINNGRKIFVK